MENTACTVLKETSILLNKRKKFISTLRFSVNSLNWSTSVKDFHLLTKFIIGSAIPQEQNKTFKVLYFDSHKFKTYTFFTSTDQQSLSWSEEINKALYPSTARRLCIIANPISGNGTSLRVLENDFLPILLYTPHTYDCFFTTYEGFIDDLLNRRDFSVYTDVICLGGDGTMKQCINGIYKHQRHLLSKLNFGILSVGSRNALACELSGKSINLSIYNIIKGITTLGDVMKIQLKGQEFLATTAVSWGVISEAADEAQHLRFFGSFRYTIVALKRIFTKWKAYQGLISFKDQFDQLVSFSSDYVFTAVSNNQVPNQQNSEILMPTARINDGMIDLMVVFFMNKCKTFAMLLRMLNHGAHLHSNYVNFIKTRYVKIEPSKLMVFNIDGEIYYGDSIVIEVVPKCLNYLGRPHYIKDDAE